MSDDREVWVLTLEGISRPVLECLSRNELRVQMPVEVPNPAPGDNRHQYAHLEAFGRTMAGIAPWLECKGLESEEEVLRAEFAQLARVCLANGTNPRSPDFFNFTNGNQPLADTAFLALGILRAPQELWGELDPVTKRNTVSAFRSTRQIKPYFKHWLLYSAMVEAALALMDEDWDKVRIDYALRQFDQWYLGDGTYSDGEQYHWDYYNSYVIHPFLIELVTRLGRVTSEFDEFRERIVTRAQRHAIILERLISPEATFPPLGRSLTYRFAAFHLLSQMAWLDILPRELPPSQIRNALTAVIRRCTKHESFDDGYWLRVGLSGYQPKLAESYISTGSLYLCLTGLTALGLNSHSQFWSGVALPWTSQKAWLGEDLTPDIAKD